MEDKPTTPKNPDFFSDESSLAAFLAKSQNRHLNLKDALRKWNRVPDGNPAIYCLPPSRPKYPLAIYKVNDESK